MFLTTRAGGITGGGTVGGLGGMGLEESEVGPLSALVEEDL